MSNGAFPPSNPYGTDFWIGGNPSGILDGDPALRLQTGRALLAQRLLCRLSTPRGSVIDCPNDCIDIRDSLSSGMTTAQIANLGSQVQQELLKDQQVTAVSVTGTFNNANSTLTMTIQVTSGQGPFTMVLAVSSVTVTLLNANLLQPLT
jgi:hypothetical protein